MGIRVISNSFKGIEVFLKVPVIIIIKIGENNVLGSIYINFGVGYMLHFKFPFIIPKNRNSIRAEPIQK